MTPSELRSYRKALRIGIREFFCRHPKMSVTSLYILLSAPFVGIADTAERLGITKDTMTDNLRHLVARGLIISQWGGPGASRPNRNERARYRLTPDGERLFLPLTPTPDPADVTA